MADKIDKGLARYYESIGVSYTNPSGVGRFKSFCLDNEDITEEIRTTYKGYVEDQVNKDSARWRRGEKIQMKEIVALELYTDFDKFQFELNGTVHPPFAPQDTDPVAFKQWHIASIGHYKPKFKNIKEEAFDLSSSDSTAMPSSYLGFLRAFDSNTNVNNHNISILHNYIQSVSYHCNRLQDLSMVSLALRTPFALFIVDTYTQCVSKYNLTINEFMANSKFLSILPCHSKPWQLIRRHLTEYLKHVYVPIPIHNLGNTHVAKRHNMAGILHYTSIIHENMYILNKVCQADAIFIPQFLHNLHWIDDKYFNKLGIKYEKFNHVEGMKKMMKNFNDKLQGKFKRSVILIMRSKNDDVCDDIIYIFEPLVSSLPATIYNYTEMPWICNTKTNVLPDLSADDYDALYLSFHRHFYHNDIQIIRVYLSYASYGGRVWKHNLKDMLEPFCIDNVYEDTILDWEEEINNKEFIDYEYNTFVNTYFDDLKLRKADLNDWLIHNMHDVNRWSQSLYQCFKKDKELALASQYMYIPQPIEYYQCINARIGEYYKAMQIEYNDKFINFIYENELQDIELCDNLGPNMDENDCLLLDFDEQFPVINNCVNKDKFVFDFLQNCYGTLLRQSKNNQKLFRSVHFVSCKN